MRKELAAAGVAKSAAKLLTIALAAEEGGRLMVKVRRTEAETTSKVTAVDGTPASVATLFVSSVRTVGVKSETDLETTVVDSVAPSAEAARRRRRWRRWRRLWRVWRRRRRRRTRRPREHQARTVVECCTRVEIDGGLRHAARHIILASGELNRARRIRADRNTASALIVASFAKFRAVGSVQPTIGYVQEVVSVAVES